jgi:hypothetical protein
MHYWVNSSAHITQQANITAAISQSEPQTKFKNSSLHSTTNSHIWYTLTAGLMVIYMSQPPKLSGFFLFLMESGKRVQWHHIIPLQIAIKNIGLLL